MLGESALWRVRPETLAGQAGFEPAMLTTRIDLAWRAGRDSNPHRTDRRSVASLSATSAITLVDPPGFEPGSRA